MSMLTLAVKTGLAQLLRRAGFPPAASTLLQLTWLQKPIERDFAVAVDNKWVKKALSSIREWGS